MTNYPPGVTGNEFEIAGPDYEEDSDIPCETCGRTQVELGYGNKFWLVCEVGHITDIDKEWPDYRDY